MSFKNTKVAELPHMEWTAHIDSRFAERSIAEITLGAVHRADRALDLLLHPHHRELRHRSVNDHTVTTKVQQIIDQNADGGMRFVQIGAHDGEFDDPFAQRIQNHGWLSLLVEPQSDAYLKLYNRYTDNPNVTPINVAIGEKAGYLTLHKAVLSGTFKNQGTAIAATSKEQVRREVMRNAGYFHGVRAKIVREQVEMITLPQLFDITGKDPSSIDFFACDTEGYDTKIMGQLLSTGAKPEFIQYEHLHAPKDEVESIDRRLRLGGYTLLRTHKDTFAYR